MPKNTEATLDPQPWITAGRRRVFGNRWVSVDLEHVALPDGSQYEYTRLLPGGTGVGVIGFNDAGEALLEREYRHGVGEVIWQLPGGLAADGEDLQQAGLRELLEETGYRPRVVSAETVRYLGAVWDNPALGPGESHMFAAWGLEKAAEPKRDAVRSGEIRDRVVTTALVHLMIAGWN